MEDQRFPVEAFLEAGYTVLYSGQKTYNGVALISRLAGTHPGTELPGFEDPQRRVLSATIGGCRIINLYVPNGSEIGSDKYAYKLAWLSGLHRWLADELIRHPRLIVLGDFNIAPSDSDVHDPGRWQNQILCSAPERGAFAGLLALGFKDAFRCFDQPEKSFTWWDYRLNGFRRNLGLRIDHILISEALVGALSFCGIDREMRGLERPSDHAPVYMDLSD